MAHLVAGMHDAVSLVCRTYESGLGHPRCATTSRPLSAIDHLRRLCDPLLDWTLEMYTSRPSTVLLSTQCLYPILERQISVRAFNLVSETGHINSDV